MRENCAGEPIIIPLKGTSITDFRWHDLRHTWASWHAQQGTPLHALQELGGWASAQMVYRYAHLSAEHLLPYADRLSRLQTGSEQGHGTISAQSMKREN